MPDVRVGESYERHRDKVRDRRAAERRAAAEIGTIPPVDDPERRDRCQRSLINFCETYRSDAFTLAWSPDHIKILERIEDSILNGGLLCIAMPRGSGKTTITIAATVWALLYGHRHWVCLIGSTTGKASSLLDGIKMVLRFNDLLADDFPNTVYPIRKVQGKAGRCASQTFMSEPTHIEWGNDTLVFPTIPGEPASGARVSVTGITGDIRGQVATTPNGEVMRPDYVVPDDPQTRESAKSKQQTTDRLATIHGDVLGLAGPTTKISGIIPCTVIQKGDLADQLLDRSISPFWHGIRTQMIYGWPKQTKMWDQYFEMQSQSLQNDGDGSDATEYYIHNREQMDEGCRAAWDQRHNNDEVSAIQHAMNIYALDPQAFWSEYQNEPIQQQDSIMLSASEIRQQTNDFEQGMVPENTQLITCFIDVQKELLYWIVVAWQKDFTGRIISYGAYPEQPTHNFELRKARRTLSKMWPKLSMEARLAKALTNLTELLASTVFTERDGMEYSINRMGIDASWGQSRDVVYTFCRHAKHKAIIIPCHGKYVGPESEPLNARHKSKSRGKTMGLHWRIAKAKDAPVRHLLYDTNFWKSFFHTRLSGDPMSTGCLTLYKPKNSKTHQMIADQLVAEFPVRVQGRNREVDIWRQRPGHPDNHLFDCGVGATVLASVSGCKTMDSRQELISADEDAKDVNDQKVRDKTPRTPGMDPAIKPKKKTKKRRKVSYV